MNQENTAISRKLIFARHAATALAVTASMLASMNHALAADYPVKPVRILVPAAPGGTSDVTARAFADKLSVRWGKAVVVDNRPGVGGLLGLNLLAQAAPDGYTLLANTSASTTFPALYKTFNLDFTKDVIQVTILVEGRSVFAVHSAVPTRTLDELVTYMRNNPGKINVGSGSALSTLQTQSFASSTGTQFEVINYPGAPQSGTALASGEIHTILALGSGLGKTLAEGGRVRLLAVLGQTRDPGLNLPSMSESQIPEVRELAKSALFAPFWIGPMAPAKTPPDIVAAIHAAAKDIVKDAEFAKRMRDVELRAVDNPQTPHDAQERLITEAAEITRAARQAGMQPQ